MLLAVVGVLMITGQLEVMAYWLLETFPAFAPDRLRQSAITRQVRGRGTAGVCLNAKCVLRPYRARSSATA